MTIRLTGLNIYPIKSARGIPLNQSVVDDFGLLYDRRWMVVDESGLFLSQRSHPRLALVVPTIGQGALEVNAPGMPPLKVPLQPSDAVATQVRVWDDVCPATWTGEHAAEWFSRFLGSRCSLVHMADQVVRPADPAYAPATTRVSFADAFPFLIISEESLADLNARLPNPLPMNRFRPNLVVAGGEPYSEDSWNHVEIGGLRLRLVKPCDRCMVTTTDQATGTRGTEPLRTLAAYRKVNGQVMFGQNAVHESSGQLRIGDPVVIR
ncbi:MAG TPA: MOSC N-terminal beta barrel domain-containing protein [Gemmatimonadales bacterium]|nr:MOSC N-terminal beta barrel domain-containing protein [Gemmatimonadales bacterium]